MQAGTSQPANLLGGAFKIWQNHSDWSKITWLTGTVKMTLLRMHEKTFLRMYWVKGSHLSIIVVRTNWTICGSFNLHQKVMVAVKPWRNTVASVTRCWKWAKSFANLFLDLCLNFVRPLFKQSISIADVQQSIETFSTIEAKYHLQLFSGVLGTFKYGANICVGKENFFYILWKCTFKVIFFLCLSSFS